MSSKTTKTNNATTNNAKTNVVVNFESLYNDLNTCTCKYELVATMLKHGYYTSTTPTATKNSNDLYIQFSDKSRLLIGKKSLKVYTNNEHATELNKLNSTLVFDKVNDGSYRVKRATITKTLENFTTIFEYFKQFATVPKTETETAK